MKSICYVIPYFGKLPNNFQIWLNSCAQNETVNWLIFTNDKNEYIYPNNVTVKYCDFSKVKKMIQDKYNFEIKIDSYWCLSLFKPAYGEIFSEYLKDFDFWGHCDIDLIWGNIRKFITEEILEKYEKIGFQGHSTIYKNTKEVNERYKTIIPNEINYIDIFKGKIKYSFDENGMETIYNYLNIPYYKETNFAHLSKYDYSFYLKYLPKENDYKNRRQVFLWKNGDLIRYYINKEKQIETEEFMYIHFFCRPISYNSDGKNQNAEYIIYPDVVEERKKDIDYSYINKKGKCSKIRYFAKSIYYNRKKLTFKKIWGNIERMIKYKIGK